MKRQAVTGLAARARLAEDGAAHHLPLAVDVEAGRLLLLQFLSWRLRLQSLSRLRLNQWECSFLALVSVHGRTKGVSNMRINRRIRRARSTQSADGTSRAISLVTTRESEPTVALKRNPQELLL